MFNNNKAQTQSVFVWLFAIIAGGAFLTLFFTITSSQQEYYERQSIASNQDLVRNLVQLLITNTNSRQTVPPPPKEVTFTCLTGENFINHEFYYKGSNTDSNMPGLPVFTPKTLPRQEWEMTSVEMDIGHPVGQAVFTAPLNHKIALNQSSTVAIRNLINQTNFEHKVTTTAPHVTYKVSTSSPRTPSIYYGNVTFNDGVTLPWIGKNMLVGALLTNNSELYECNLRKIQNLLQTSVEVSNQRAQIIETEIGGSCQSIYANVKRSLAVLKGNMNIINNPSAYIRSLQEVLRQKNGEVQFQSCPSLF